MKRINCPQCGHQLAFDETRHAGGKTLAFVCPQCGRRFKVSPEKRDFPYGFVSVIENSFTNRQDLPLALGDNVIGRRNKDTGGVDVPILTDDPSMGRSHCVICVRETGDGALGYFLRDFPSLTGTFVRNTLVGRNEQVRIGEGAIVTIGATTFILHTADGKEWE